MKIPEWLKHLFIHPREENPEMSEPLSDATPVTAAPVAETPTPATEVQAGVKDLKAALAFIESGIGHLGEAAKDELVALAQKYL
jgi:hypothetical protein